MYNKLIGLNGEKLQYGHAYDIYWATSSLHHNFQDEAFVLNKNTTFRATGATAQRGEVDSALTSLMMLTPHHKFKKRHYRIISWVYVLMYIAI